MIHSNFAKRALVDSLLIGALLIGANWLISRGDLGWTKLNPSPYLLLPILIGCRFGFAPGILSGVMAGILVLVLRGNLQADLLRQILSEERYLFCAFPIVGSICGELSHHFLRQTHHLTLLNEKLTDRLKKNDADNRYLRDARDELERAMAARDGELSTVDTELRRLYSLSLDEIPKGILLLLNRQTRVSDAALYMVDDTGDRLKQVAAIGNPERLPHAFQSGDIEMAQLAWTRKTLVTLPEILGGPTSENPEYLVAIPFLNSSDQPFALLLVSGMPFISFNAQTIEQLSILAKWTAEILDLKTNASGKYRLVSNAENQKIFTLDFFEHLLKLAAESYRKHRIPSSLIIFSGDGTELPQSSFESILMPALRAGDYAAVLDRPYPNLAILLPVTGERGASICKNRILQYWRDLHPELPLPKVDDHGAVPSEKVIQSSYNYEEAPIEV